MARRVMSLGWRTPDLETQMMHMVVSSFVIGCDIHHSAGRESQAAPVFPARLISKLTRWPPSCVGGFRQAG